MHKHTNEEIQYNNAKIQKIHLHIKQNKKDYSAKIALMKTVARLRKNKKYLLRIRNKKQNT